MKTVKVSISLPADLVREMKSLSTNLSAFVARGMREYLAKEYTRKALRDSVEAWGAENHPDLGSMSEIEKYVENLRSEWRHEK